MKDQEYKAGLVSISFRKLHPRQILDAMSECGLQCIEWGADVHAPCNDDKRLSEIIELQKHYGIYCSSYGTYFRLGETPMNELEAHILAAKRLGTSILRLWCGGKSGADMSADERSRLSELCHIADETAKRNDAILCMECHKKTFTERVEDAVWLMKEIDSPNFRMYWQPFQWQSAEENIKNARAIAPFAKHIHVFNWNGKEKLPLSGAIEKWRDYLREFSGPRTLLLEFMPDDSIGSLSREARALYDMIGEMK